MTRLRALVIVPAWNEQSSIFQVVAEIIRHGHDVLVVSDGSTDNTPDLARDAGARVLELPVNLGVGGALRAGFRYAVTHDYEAIIQCDADGQHPVGDIQALIDTHLDCGADMIIGSRFANGENFSTTSIRRLAMRTLAFIARRSAGVHLSDVSSGFRIIAQPLLGEFARDFPSTYLGDTFEAVISASRAGYTIAEIPVSMKQRQHGRSSASTGAAVRYVARVLIVVLLGIEIKIRPAMVTRAVNHE